MLITVDACAAQHQGDRKEQQDRLAILPHVHQRGVALAVVADGVGAAGGALAAEQVVLRRRPLRLLFADAKWRGSCWKTACSRRIS
jgi:serine/threonine protein phosphatase PrpC